MARISTYAIDGTPASSDKLIGTDSSGTTTKNYPLGSVSDWLKESGASAVLGQNNYTFQIVADPDTGRLPGTISFDNYGGDGTEFSNITTFRLSKISSTGKNVANYLLSTVGDKVILGQLDDLNNFGVYTLVSLVENPSETGFYDATLLFVEGNGALLGDGLYGLATHSASESAVWGNIEGTVTNQTDLVNYIDAEIAAIPVPATPTLQSVTDAGNTTTNSIGIGTTPQHKLHVDGNIMLKQYGRSIYFGSTVNEIKGDSSNFLYKSFSKAEWDNAGTYANSSYVFKQGGSEVFRINTGGNVGIGTTAPAAKLDVNGTTYLRSVALDTVFGYSSNNIQFINTGNTTFASNVGIGTTSPTEKLEVAGGNVLLDTNTWIGSGSGSGQPRLRFDNTNSQGKLQQADLVLNDEKSIAWSNTGTSIQGRGADNQRIEFNVASSERMRITNAGNVGIGTTGPTEKLDVAGNIKLRGTNNLTIGSTSSGGNFSLSSGIRGYNFSNNNGDLLRIDSTGNVGIGTTAPALQSGGTGLHINAPAHSEIKFTNSTTGSGAADGTALVSSGVGFTINNRESGHLSLGTNNSTRLYIDSAGNVGIGTTSPTEKLEVAGTYGNTTLSGHAIGFTRAAANYLWAKTSGGSLSFTVNGNPIGSPSMVINSSGNVGIGTTSPGAKLEVNSGGGIHLTDDVAGRTLIIKPSLSGAIHQFTSDNTAAGYSFSNNASELMRITSAGKIGIGTTSPAEKLHVNGEVRVDGNDGVAAKKIRSSYFSTTQNLDLQTGSSADIILTTRNVGIGTTSPSTKLQLKGNSTYITVNNNSNHNSVQIGSDSSGDGALVLRGSSGNNKIYLSAESNTNNYINSGKVGIGTTSPGAALEINSTEPQLLIKNPISSNGNATLRFEEQSGSTQNATITFNQGGQNSLTIATGYQSSNDENLIHLAPAGNIGLTVRGGTGSNDGNVGIGTTAPDVALEVAGTIKASTHADGLVFGSPTTVKHKLGVYGGNDLLFKDPNNNVLMALTSAGKFGIGTTAPDAMLHIKGSSTSTEVKIDTNNNSISDSAFIKFNASRAQVGWIDSAVTLTDGGGNKDIKLKVNTGSIFLQTNNTNRLTVASGGKVGIGTTSPGKTLDITGEIRTSGRATFNEYVNTYMVYGNTDLNLGYAGGTSGIFIKGSGTLAGNVGIGTTSPGEKLDVSGTGQIQSKITSTDNNGARFDLHSLGGQRYSLQSIAGVGGDFMMFDETSGHMMARYGEGASGYWQFRTNNVERMRITSSGNVGIGTTAPTSKIHINGTAMAQLRMQASGGPGSSNAANGGVGDMAYDDDYFYIKTANGWGRMALDFGF